MEHHSLPDLINEFLTKEDSVERFKERLFPVVLDLLMHNTGYLYQVLYRIDVKEEKVKSSFFDNPMVELAAERITNLIVERQIEKIQWRKKYSDRG